MDRKELIKKYIEFFKSKKHAEVPNASLVPENDPTVLFTTAGMHPLVPFLLGGFITLGSIYGWYSPVQGYQMVCFIMLLVITAIAYVVKGISIKSYPVGHFFNVKNSKSWGHFRWLMFIFGFNTGVIGFIIPLLVLIFITNKFLVFLRLFLQDIFPPRLFRQSRQLNPVIWLFPPGQSSRQQNSSPH